MGNIDEDVFHFWGEFFTSNLTQRLLEGWKIGNERAFQSSRRG
jgi:hypothetical protein